MGYALVELVIKLTYLLTCMMIYEYTIDQMPYVGSVVAIYSKVHNQICKWTITHELTMATQETVFLNKIRKISYTLKEGVLYLCGPVESQSILRFK